MLYNFLVFMDDNIFNKKSWFQRNKFDFIKKFFFIVLIFFPSFLYFSSNRLILFFSFCLVIFIINLVIIKIVYRLQSSYSLDVLTTLTESYNSLMYINSRINSLNIVGKENWRFLKLSNFFLLYIKYGLIINNKKLNADLLNLY
jgi:hypothetical protein